MDLGLTVINGFLIVAVIGYALVLWQQGTATIGTVAAASALVLRLNAMTGWIMWSLSSLFQNLGVIREGMETIAQPIAPHRRARRRAARASPAARSPSTASATTTAAAPAACARSPSPSAPARRSASSAAPAPASRPSSTSLLRFFDTEGGAIRIDGQDIARRHPGLAAQPRSAW